MPRDDTIRRVERALWQHAPRSMSYEPAGRGVLIRCDCQPDRARPYAQADWLRHVAEHVTDEAMRLPGIEGT